MKLYGIWVAQNEADVLQDVLDFLKERKYFEKIFFFDLGSQDNTFEIASRNTDLLHEPQRLNVPYSGQLRVDLINEHREFYKDGDWVAIIDSDEFYAEDPRHVIDHAENEGAVQVDTMQIMYYFTDRDLKAADEEYAAPVRERLQHYIINWSEARFYKAVNLGGSGSCINLQGRLSSKLLLNRHYPYRSPRQIQEKIRIRLENRRVGGNPQYQIYSDQWRDYIVDHHLLHRYDGTWRFGLPDGVDWKRFYNFWNNDSTGWKNIAYNNTYIYWLMARGLIPQWSPAERAFKLLGKGVQYVRGRNEQLRA
jgi:hypothetical protein